MKEFLQGIVAYGPRFLAEFAELVSAPKTFLRNLDYGAEDIVARALTFYVLCLAIGIVLELPFLASTKELWVTFAITIALFMVGTVMIAAMYRIAFRCVGGKGSYRDHLLVTLYVSGPFYIGYALGSAACKGIVLANAPDLYPLFTKYTVSMTAWTSDIFHQEQFQPLMQFGPVGVAVALFNIVLIGATIWIMVCWGGYRQINGVGRARSTMALIVSTALSAPLYYVLVSAQRGLGVLA